MADTLQYRCPNCGGTLIFDSKIQKMFCKYCDNEYTVEELSKQDVKLEETVETDTDELWTESEQEGMFVYECSHCGGQIIGDENLGATTCPYCDTPVVIKEKFRGDLKPKYIIPFKIKKEAVKESLLKMCKNKKFLPDSFLANNRIDTIKGLYVPFWLFDCDSQSKIDYSCTIVDKSVSGNTETTVTKFYDVTLNGKIDFYKVPVDGSENMDNAYMNSIEPYNYDEMVPFQSAYLAGYLADRYDVDKEKAKEDANIRVQRSVRDYFSGELKGSHANSASTARQGESKKRFDTAKELNADINIDFKSADYVLMPVWMLSTNYNNKIYTFAMNGQNGKFIGELPLDPQKKKKYIIKRILIIMLIGVLIFVLPKFLLLI